MFFCHQRCVYDVNKKIIKIFFFFCQGSEGHGLMHVIGGASMTCEPHLVLIKIQQRNDWFRSLCQGSLAHPPLLQVQSHLHLQQHFHLHLHHAHFWTLLSKNYLHGYYGDRKDYWDLLNCSYQLNRFADSLFSSVYHA